MGLSSWYGSLDSAFLPGVFDSNPYPGAINGSLWTLPWEFLCYILLSLTLFVVRLFGKFAIFSIGIVVFCGFCVSCFSDSGMSLEFENFSRLFFFFYAGMLVSAFPRLQHVDLQWGIVSLAIMLILGRGSSAAYQILVSVLTVISTASFALAEKPIFGRVFQKNDFSYGIYIYAFPLQQTLVFYLGTDCFGGHVEVYSVAAWTITLIFGVVSWFAIEKPMMALGRKITGKHREFCQARENTKSHLPKFRK